MGSKHLLNQYEEPSDCLFQETERRYSYQSAVVKWKETALIAVGFCRNEAIKRKQNLYQLTSFRSKETEFLKVGLFQKEGDDILTNTLFPSETRLDSAE